MTPLISVIIPCYNCASYIMNALTPLLGLSDIEIIVVNDCSPDNLDSVINDNCALPFENNSFVYIKNATNLGAGESRNVGISLSNGQYLLFLDSDDYISAESIEELKEFTKRSADVVFFDYYKIKNKKRIPQSIFYNNFNAGTISKKDAFIFARGSTWGKMYKRKTAIVNNVKFGNMKISEDFVFTKHMIYCSNSFYYIKKPFYGYRDTSNSLMHRFSKDIDNYELIAFKSLQRKVLDADFVKMLDYVFYLEVLYGYNIRIFLSGANFFKKRRIFKQLLSMNNYKETGSIFPIKYRLLFRLMRALYLC